MKDERGSARQAVSNWHTPMPLGRKLWLFARNNFRKLRTGQSCCGHPGEPGC
jgi:hypothetical protein